MAYSSTIQSGVTISNILIKDDARYHVKSGGIMKTVSATSGEIHVSEGGLVSGFSTTSGGNLTAYSGAIVRDCNMNGGRLAIQNGGFVENITISRSTPNSLWGVFVYGGGSACNLTVGSNGLVDVSGGNVDGISLASGAQLKINANGTVENLSAEAGAKLLFSITQNTNLTGTSAGATLEIRNGVASGCVVNLGEALSFGFGGRGIDIIENGGYVNVASGANVTFVPNTISGLYLGYIGIYDDNFSATIHSGTTALDTTIGDMGYLFIYSGGVANNTMLNGGDSYLTVSSGGVVNNTTINCYWGGLRVSSGGVANGITLNDNGEWEIGHLNVTSGGTATDVTATTGRGLEIAVDSNTFVAGTIAGSAFEIKDGFLSNTFISAGAFTILSGGIAKDVIISGMKIDSDYYYDEFGGTLRISSGGVADNITICSGGNLYVSSGGIIDNITVNGGNLYVSSGGTATVIDWTPGNGTISLAEGAYVNLTSQYSGVVFGNSRENVLESQTISGNSTMYVMSDGTARKTKIDSGSLLVYSGGSADNTTINSQGRMYVYSGGTVNEATVNQNGYMAVYSGGTATGISVSSGARLKFDVVSDTFIQGTLANGSTFELKNGVLSNYTVNSGAEVNVYGSANSVTINQGGKLAVTSGARATNLIVSDGANVRFDIESGTYVQGVIVGWNGSNSSAFEMRNAYLSNFTFGSVTTNG